MIEIERLELARRRLERAIQYFKVAKEHDSESIKEDAIEDFSESITILLREWGKMQ